MIAYVLYNRQTPGEGLAAELVERLEPERIEAELIDADSPRGIQLAEHYDVLGRPAVVLVKADGALVRLWQGETDWPLLSDMTYLAHQ